MISDCGWGVSASALNFVAAALHGVQAIAVFALITWLNTQPRSGMLFNGGHFDLVRVVPVWRETTIDSVIVDSGSIDVLYVILAFFILSAVFQCAGGLLSSTTMAARLRYVEYSFSAAIMMLAIALEAGIRDLYTLQCMFVLISATQMFGLLSDVVSDFATRPMLLLDQRHQQGAPPSYDAMELWLWVLPHTAGWATCMSAYGPAIDVFLQSAGRSDRHPPDFVTALVFLELVMFSCFGAVQTYGLMRKTLLCVGWDGCQPEPTPRRASTFAEVIFQGEAYVPQYAQQPQLPQPQLPQPQPLTQPQPRSGSGAAAATTKSDYYTVQPIRSLSSEIDGVDATCEYAFIVLSLVAKTLLCWIVLAPLLTERMKEEA